MPFYRDLFDGAGLGPSDVRTLDDLRGVPLLSKDTVAENLYHGMLSNNHDKRRMLRVATSGSTGEPFVCYADRHQLEIRWAATLRGLEMTGYRFGDRQVRLWHQTIGMGRVQVAQEKLDALLSRRVFIPAFEISDANVEQVLETIRRYRPVLLDGYAESLHLLARHLGQRSLRECGVKAIVTSAQSLPGESRRVPAPTPWLPTGATWPASSTGCPVPPCPPAPWPISLQGPLRPPLPPGPATTPRRRCAGPGVPGTPSATTSSVADIRTSISGCCS